MKAHVPIFLQFWTFFSKHSNHFEWSFDIVLTFYWNVEKTIFRRLSSFKNHILCSCYEDKACIEICMKLDWLYEFEMICYANYMLQCSISLWGLTLHEVYAYPILTQCFLYRTKAQDIWKIPNDRSNCKSWCHEYVLWNAVQCRKCIYGFIFSFTSHTVSKY